MWVSRSRSEIKIFKLQNTVFITNVFEWLFGTWAAKRSGVCGSSAEVLAASFSSGGPRPAGPGSSLETAGLLSRRERPRRRLSSVPAQRVEEVDVADHERRTLGFRRAFQIEADGYARRILEVHDPDVQIQGAGARRTLPERLEDEAL